MIVVAPFPVKYARAWVKRVHRRLPDLTGAMWCIGAWVQGEMRGLAVVGRPNARMLDVAAGEPINTLQVLRVAVVEGTPNACSRLYGACSRSAKGMGASGLFTYIHDDESGISLKASGWIEDRLTDGGEWTRPSRQRRLALEAGSKRRFWAPWSLAALRVSPPATEG